LPLHPLPRRSDDDGDHREPLSRREDASRQRSAENLLRHAQSAGPEEEAVHQRTARLAEAPSHRRRRSRNTEAAGPDQTHPTPRRRAPEERSRRDAVRTPRLPGSARAARDDLNLDFARLSRAWPPRLAGLVSSLIDLPTAGLFRPHAPIDLLRHTHDRRP